MLSGESSRQLTLPNPSTGHTMERMAKVQVMSSILSTLELQSANKSQLWAIASTETRETPSPCCILKECKILPYNLSAQQQAHQFSRKISKLSEKQKLTAQCVDNKLKIRDLFIRVNTHQSTSAKAQLVSTRKLRKVMSLQLEIHKE